MDDTCRERLSRVRERLEGIKEDLDAMYIVVREGEERTEQARAKVEALHIQVSAWLEE